MKHILTNITTTTKENIPGMLIEWMTESYIKHHALGENIEIKINVLCENQWEPQCDLGLFTLQWDIK